MLICYKCGQESYIKYAGHFVCSKHYNLAVNEVFNKVVEKSESKSFETYKEACEGIVR